MALSNATISSSETDIFTCANAGGTAITAIVITNMDSVAHQVWLHARPAGETADGENTILEGLSLAATNTYVFEGKLILANTDKISAVTDNSDSVVVATCSYLNL